ncbi:MAG: hypothetical protein ACYC2Y_04590 [Armatimonadota bacterium]
MEKSAHVVDILTIATAIVSALLSGIVVAIFNNRLTNKIREASYLKDQLQNLYGPLEYHATLIRTASNLFFKADNAGINLQGNLPKNPEEKIETLKCTQVMIEYGLRVLEYDSKMLDILEQNYSYADPDDMEVFNEFFFTCMRNKTEYDKDGQLKIGKRLQKELGSDTPLCHPDTIKRIREKFLAKQKRLKELGG